VSPSVSRCKVSVVRVRDLSEAQVDTLWSIMQRYYEAATFEQFQASLREKTYAVLLHDRATGQLMGFTCLLLYSRVFEGRRVRVVFGGDTIVERSHWGEGKSIASACAWLMLKIYLQRPWLPLYFFLISKGYKTYMLMARNFARYYPSCRWDTPAHLRRLTDFLAVSRYGTECYDAQVGVLKFPYVRKRLIVDVAPITSAELRDPDIAFFARANPTHHEGHELACVAPVDLACFAGVLRKLVPHYLRALSRR
jgi:hypothetical protein